jgi:hypothetical protein
VNEKSDRELRAVDSPSHHDGSDKSAARVKSSCSLGRAYASKAALSNICLIINQKLHNFKVTLLLLQTSEVTGSRSNSPVCEQGTNTVSF